MTRRYPCMRVAVLLTAVVLSASASAQPTGVGARPPAPLAEALAACKAIAAGKACNFSTPQGNVSGSCWAPEGKPLACRPAGPPPAASAAHGRPDTP